MRDPLDIARNAVEHAITEGIREDEQHHGASEAVWLTRAQVFAFISIGESLREIIEWAAIGELEDVAQHVVPERSEPLVMCGDPHPDDGTPCQRRIGHLDDWPQVDIPHGVMVAPGDFIEWRDPDHPEPAKLTMVPDEPLPEMQP